MTRPIITDSMITQARALQARTFDLQAVITRQVWIDDGAGGTYPGDPVLINVACRISEHKSAAGEQLVAGALVGQSLFDVTFPAGTDVRLADRFSITFSGGDTRSYEVLNMSAPKSRETARVVLCQERG